METTLGGDRLGSGNKQKLSMRNYERSNHNLGYIWRSTMSAGTLVPFMKVLGLPGDSFDIELDADVLTHPTIGPLFGSYKVQLDVFGAPVRLYQAKVNMNMVKIGMDMAKVGIPQMTLIADVHKVEGELDNSQINPSSIFNYLGIKGLGTALMPSGEYTQITRNFNAVPWLAYWDIYKAYYANKQEERGFVIHNPLTQSVYDGIENAVWNDSTGVEVFLQYTGGQPANPITVNIVEDTNILIEFDNLSDFDPDNVMISVGTGSALQYVRATQLFSTWVRDGAGQGNNVRFWNFIPGNGIWDIQASNMVGGWYMDNTIGDLNEVTPKLSEFPLENIDKMRMRILKNVESDVFAYGYASPDPITPYSYMFEYVNSLEPQRHYYSMQSNQEGLGIKTYQSDLLNNWLNTEWIDGDNGVNAITAVSVTDGKFTIDALNLAKKVYDMLNRVALSDGTYDAWQEATYDQKRVAGPTQPIYYGGLSKELVFQEVISNTTTEDQPLGTLAGRGVLGKKHKGGKVKIRVDEPMYIIGIVSLTPRIDYSQGNDWDVNLFSYADFHAPALDGIGFQDLITEQMAWWDTYVNAQTAEVVQRAAGKQTAWINYTTEINKTYGNFAIQSNQMFMTLNRRYEADWSVDNEFFIPTIKDLTTYIDPVKYNHIFAQTSIDAQNFWVQIAVENFARRKMSARQIPNL